MTRPLGVLAPVELDATTFPMFRDRILAAEGEAVEHATRSYPGHPKAALPRTRARLGTALDRVLVRRRSRRELSSALPAAKTLARILQYAHAVNAAQGRGPTPTAGALNALELYVVVLGEGWLARGHYHYDRAAHELTLLRDGATRSDWEARVPSLTQLSGGALLWIIAGDGARAEAKYGERAARFLLLEAGHLMQNLCLLSASVGLSTLPLGGFFEREIGRVLPLSRTDVVLYAGALG